MWMDGVDGRDATRELIEHRPTHNLSCLQGEAMYDVNMKKHEVAILIVLLLLSGHALAGTSTSDEELEVTLQFFEFDLEDLCILKSEAEWQYLTGNRTDLKELWQLELREADLYKNESKLMEKYAGRTFFSERLQRFFNIFSYPGAPLLGLSELREYTEYSVKLMEINRGMTVGCRQAEESVTDRKETKCVGKNKRQVNEILAHEKNEEKLRNLWSDWFQELDLQNRKTNFDFIQKLSILDIEAEQNEEDDLSDYWLKQSDIEKIDYQSLSEFWNELTPLYESLKKYMATLIERTYGDKVFVNGKLFPTHLLGSLDARDWVVAAERMGAFSHVKSYQQLKSSLSQESVESVYRMADKFTTVGEIEELPDAFYNNSNFHVSTGVCTGKIMDFCSRKNVQRAIACSDESAMTISRFIRIHEDVARLKHVAFAGKELPEEENGYFFREGPRDSAVYEAVAGLSSVLAMRPGNLRNQGLLPEAALLHDEEMLSLLLTALDVIPSLPYYLAADLWRINALKEMDESVGETAYESTTVTPASSSMTPTTASSDEEEEEKNASSELRKREVSDEMDDSAEEKETNDATEVGEVSKLRMSAPSSTRTPGSGLKVYDIKKLTVDWWRLREGLQGIANADGKLYLDFLQDDKIIWNKPYVSKFLGKIVQFQLLDYFKRGNATTNPVKMQSLLLKGKSQPFQKILSELFDITEISTKPLIQYFAPLKEFLDSGRNFSHIQMDNLILLPKSFSMNPHSIDQGRAQKGSNTVAFSILILLALCLIGVSVFVSLTRYLAKRASKRRRKCIT